MADLIQRTFKVAEECGMYDSCKGCCQEQNFDTYGNVLQNFGVDIYDGE